MSFRWSKWGDTSREKRRQKWKNQKVRETTNSVFAVHIVNYNLLHISIQSAMFYRLIVLLGEEENASAEPAEEVHEEVSSAVSNLV
jgi:hypothetical protein